MMKFPTNLKVFVTEQQWTFAKTYASTWPHEYIVRERVDETLFIRLVSILGLMDTLGISIGKSGSNSPDDQDRGSG